MKPIVTLTLNPCVDGACEAETVQHTHKVRTSNARYDPGGGGINVARVVSRLGGQVTPVYFSGGATGALLEELLVPYDFVASHPIRIADHTRISNAVFERASGREYRFVPEGPEVHPADWQACLGVLEQLDFAYLVVSGSSPHGFPDECYAEIARLAQGKGARFVLDSSGPAFASAIQRGGVYLAKPSLGEFCALTGLESRARADIEAAAQQLVADGKVETIAVTLGHDGALLVTGQGVTHLMPPQVDVQSAVGAGDSFLGAMVFALSRGDAITDAFVLGVAAGAAAVLTPGTELCRAEDVVRLYERLRTEPVR